MSDAGSVRDFAVGPFRAAATSWLSAQDHPPAVHPSRASTVLLLRGEPLEVFMIERSARMEFAPSTWVFPGGRVDPADEDLAPTLVTSGDVAGAAGRVGEPAEALAGWFVAAVRELFEEAGVLLAADADAQPGVMPEGMLALRADLEAHRIGLADVLGGRELRLDLLTVVDRWITPEFEQRRYDTLFFCAVLPVGARADAVTREAQQGRWVRPSDMLAAADRDEVRLLPPTRTRLESLAQDASAAAAFDRSRADSRPIIATRPWAEQGPDGPFLRAEVNP